MQTSMTCSTSGRPFVASRYAPGGRLRLPTCRASAGSRDQVTESLRTLGRQAKTQLQRAGQAVSVQLSRWSREYDLEQKAQRSARRVEEWAKDVDQQYNVRRRARNSLEYLQRMWPMWQKQLDEFSGTWYGKTTILVAIVLVVSSPLFWRFVNVFLLLWWLAIPLAAGLVNAAQQRAAEQAAASAADEERRRNPFSSIFGSQAASSRGGSRKYQPDDGPIVDAEWQVIEPEEPGPGTQASSRKQR